MRAGAKIKIYPKFSDIGLHSTDLGHIGDAFVRVERLEFELQLVPGNAGQIEKVVDQLALQFDISPDHRQRRPRLLELLGQWIE